MPRGREREAKAASNKRPPRQQRPAVRDPRPPGFADDANQVLQHLKHPCVVKPGGGGLGVFAARAIAAGECVIVERPLVLTVAFAERAHICAGCLADSRTCGLVEWTERCTSCQHHFYCSERCHAGAQRRRHDGVECAALAKVSWDAVDEDDHDTVCQAIRMLVERVDGHALFDVGPAGTLGPAGTAHAERLVGITPSTHTAREAIQRAATAALAALPPAARMPTSELIDLLERHGCNLYGVTGKGGEDVACASFVGYFHLFNHACHPNLVFDSATPVASAQPDAGLPPMFALRALEDISEGAELCISYTSSAEGPSQRQEHLREYYGFDCVCARCTCDDIAVELDFADLLDAMRCGVEGCGSGLSVPVLEEADPQAGALDEDDDEDGRVMRCVHCGETWRFND